ARLAGERGILRLTQEIDALAAREHRQPSRERRGALEIERLAVLEDVHPDLQHRLLSLERARPVAIHRASDQRTVSIHHLCERITVALAKPLQGDVGELHEPPM